MNLKNYSSNVPAMATISYIEAYLMECGATGIAKEIKNGAVAAVFFECREASGRKHTIKLPANVEAVHEYLWRDYVTGMTRPKKTKEDFKQQAERTAWKIMQDWTQVQMSLVKLKENLIMTATCQSK